MSDLADLYNGSIARQDSNLLEAKIHDNANAPSDEVRCIVPAIDAHQATDEMQWMPRVTGVGVYYPKVGDRAVIAIPDGGPPFIAAWWPHASSPDKAF